MMDYLSLVVYLVASAALFRCCPLPTGSKHFSEKRLGDLEANLDFLVKADAFPE
jgi:hypothetical protein